MSWHDETLAGRSAGSRTRQLFAYRLFIDNDPRNGENGPDRLGCCGANTIAAQRITGRDRSRQDQSYGNPLIGGSTVITMSGAEHARAHCSLLTDPRLNTAV